MGEMIRAAAKKPEAKRENRPSQTQKTGPSQSISSPVEQILFLQRTIGNQAVGKMIKSGALQAKLRIGQPGDIYEQEADRMANAVMRMPEPGVQRQVEPEEEETLQPKPLASQITPLLQVQRQEEPEEEEETLQAKPLAGQITPLVQRQVEPEEEEEEELQAKATSGRISVVNSNLESYIQSFKGGGQPLSENDRAFFEQSFSTDFSQVRMHTDTRAGESAQAVNAQAFTVGQDVVFGMGQYAPGTSAGRRLIGHELTHVVQQRGNTHVSGVDSLEGLIQRSLEHIEDLLREKFDYQKDPRLYERRKSLNLQFRYLISSDAKVLFDRIINPTKDDIISERFQTLARSTRRELLLILCDKIEHRDAEILHEELTQKTPKEKQLQARFKELVPKKKIREELLDCLSSKFSSAHKAPSGKKAPWVNLKDENFKTTGSISPDNNCEVCGASKFNKLGVNWSTATNAMELRGDVSGDHSNAKYDFKRTRESGTWIKVGSWDQIEYNEPGTDDDTLGNTDEHLTPDPSLNHIYVADAPGFRSLDPAGVYGEHIMRNASEYVRKHNFEEWVLVKVGTGGWTIASIVFQWHSVVWLEKVNGKWQRKKDALNEIGPNNTFVEKGNLP
ncbi:MAG: DUF4157 domain-containing protein [Candidatus Omnitrophica bacterium]|nr:DUF4157 domain-containing protein [Candidatus Omnitrophota bacterium]